jgi:hypothetical protein
MNKLSFVFLLGAAIAAGGLTWAQSQLGHGGHAGHGATNSGAIDHGAHGAHGAHAVISVNPVISAYRAANERMHTNMAIEFTGEADVDFVRGMIPHHQGAIDMARIVLEHGSDPDIRTLAEAVIGAQEGEIAMMRVWLAARGLN